MAEIKLTKYFFCYICFNTKKGEDNLRNQVFKKIQKSNRRRTSNNLVSTIGDFDFLALTP